MADLTGPAEPSLSEHRKVTAATEPRKVSEECSKEVQEKAILSKLKSEHVK